jgi:hypothetical protein
MAALTLALAVITAGYLAAVAGNAQGAAASATVNVGSPETSVPPIPSGFIGLSMEYSAILPYVGTNPRAINPVFVHLIQNLAPGQSPVLRIGGDSTDWSWWPDPGMRRPYGIRYNITPAWIAGTNALVKATNARLILGIDLEAGSTRIAGTEARALVSGLGRQHIAALEIGNEPELYAVRFWYDPPGGHPVRGRSPNYSFNNYLSEFTRYRKLVPAVPIAGPSIGNFAWMSMLPQFLGAQPKLGMVTFHRYGLNRCVGSPTSPHYPSVPNLLAPFASRGLMNGATQFIAQAHQYGDPFRVDEMNSVTCGGVLGVSNTFSAALWAIDALFTMAHDGVDGVNIHTFPRSYNELFDFTRRHGRWHTTTVRPEYYGLWLFAQAAPPGSQFLHVTGSSNGDTLRSWATRGPDGKTRVVLINDSGTQAFATQIQAAGAAQPASVERLQAPSAYATSGVKIGGRTFDPRTTSGTLGPPRTTLSQPSAGGYPVTMPPASAALITIPGP